MKVKRTIEIPPPKKPTPRTRVVLDHVLCDLCKKRFDDEDWGKDCYDVLETEVRMKTGNHWPDSGDTEETVFDICPDCFRDVLMPFLKSKGAEPTIEEVSW